MISYILIFIYLSFISSHNWIGTPSRARLAAVQKPCQARVSSDPHIQLKKGQDINIEWSIGHGDSGTRIFYYVIIHADDFNSLNLVEDNILDEYIANAPASSFIVGPQYQKRHLQNKNKKISGTSESADKNGNMVDISTFFERVIPPSDPIYINRDATGIKRSKAGTSTANFVQVKYRDSALVGDAAVSYYNEKYPWIESVYRYVNSVTVHSPFAEEYDTAMLKIAGRKGPGDYIINFKWGGYRDCTDVNLQPEFVEHPFGIINNTAAIKFAKNDHCEYSFIQNPVTNCRIAPAGDASACIADCAKNSGCYGVQLTRVSNPDGTLPYTPNIPWHKWTDFPVVNGMTQDPVGPCDFITVDQREKAGCSIPNPKCNITALNPSPNDYVCYGLYPYRDPDLQTVDDFAVTNEPTDPKFYSTCWVKNVNGGFLPGSIPPNRIPVWNVGDKCVRCDFITQSHSLPVNIAPDWVGSLQDGECIDCNSNY